MKRILGLILILCLVLSAAAECFAAGKPEISEQPKSATTSKKGVVSFSIKVKTNGSKVSYSWYFVDPQSGEKISAKNLSKKFKSIKVANPNSKKVTLKKVPEEMHGWTVYCHLSGNGYKLDSESVVLNVYGKDPVEAPAQSEAPPADEGKTEGKEEEKTDEPKAEEPKNTEEGGDESESGEAEPEDREITVTGSGNILYQIDSMGNLKEDKGVSSLTFMNSGSFAVRSDEAIKSWTINGVRFEPQGEVTGFNVMNVTENTTVSLSVARKTAATATVDDNVSCKVTCKNCSFTYMPKELKSASSGEVPSGAVIFVFANNSASVPNGYRINGGEPEYQGLGSFQLTITGDTEISMD